MNYIIIDLEFNQAFPFDKKNKIPNPQCKFEIIQIGAIKYNNKFEYIDELSLFIKPQIYKKLHPYVKKITHFTDETFKDSRSFQEIFPEFLDFVDDESILCVWGKNDVKLLFNNAEFYDIDINLLPTNYIDVQSLISKNLKLPKGQVIGLENAIRELNINIDNSFHNALNDAKYTGKLLKSLSKQPLNHNTYNPHKKQKVTNKTVDLGSLYKYAEKEFGKPLGKKTQKVIKNIYFLGMNKYFNKKND
ncbi:MAG: exonuclease domain-containing protein [Lachnospirales bacterium]